VEYGTERPAWLHWSVKSENDTLYIFAVNDGDGEGLLDFIFPTDIEYVLDITENRMIQTVENEFNDYFNRFDIRIYKVK
jgi:hypothetical protein